MTNMTDEQLYELLLKAEDEETEASSKYHHLLKQLAPASTRGAFRSGDPSVLGDLLAAEKVRTDKQQAADKALKAFIDQRWGDKKQA